jgi:hypothetical protein
LDYDVESAQIIIPGHTSFSFSFCGPKTENFSPPFQLVSAIDANASDDIKSTITLSVDELLLAIS